MKKITYEKWLGSNSVAGKTAQSVSNFVGGRGLTEYAGGRGTKKDALKSAALVGTAIAGGAAYLGRKALVKGVGAIASRVSLANKIRKGKKLAKFERGRDAKWADPKGVTRKFRREEEEIFKSKRK